MSKLFSFYFSLWFLTISRESVAMVVKKVELTELGEQVPREQLLCNWCSCQLEPLLTQREIDSSVNASEKLKYLEIWENSGPN